MNIKISNTNPSKRGDLPAVRVYLNGEMVAEVRPNKRNPLAYIREHNGRYRKALLEQCVDAGIPVDVAKNELGV